MLLMMLRNTQWASCTGDVYPIVHGNYVTDVQLPNVPSTYYYKYARNPTTVDLNMYSNGDILITYYFQIVDGFQNTDNFQNSNSTYGQTSGVAKINYLTGEMKWAKEIYAVEGNNLFLIAHTYIVNDFSWSLLTMNKTPDNLWGIVFKIDLNGISQEKFAVMNSYSSLLSNQMIYINNFSVLPDSSIIILAQTTYLQNEFGISNSSQLDLSIFKLNSNKEFEWGTSVDYFNDIDELASTYTYNNTIYLALSTAMNYLWLFTLDTPLGYIQNSQWIYLPKSSSELRMYYVFFVSKLLAYTSIYTNGEQPSYIAYLQLKLNNHSIN